MTIKSRPHTLVISHPSEEQPMKAVIMEIQIHSTEEAAQNAAIHYFTSYTTPEVVKSFWTWPQTFLSFSGLLDYVRRSDCYDIAIDPIFKEQLPLEYTTQFNNQIKQETLH